MQKDWFDPNGGSMPAFSGSCASATFLLCFLAITSNAQQPSAQSAPTAASEASTQSQVQQPLAQQVATPAQIASKGSPTGADDRGEAATSLKVQYAQMGLVMFVLVVLGYLFWVMIHYSNRIAQTGPLGIQITDALDEVRRQRTTKTLTEKWETGGYHTEVLNDQTWVSAHGAPPIPPELNGEWVIGEARRQLLQYARVGTLPPGISSSKDESELKTKAKTEYLQTLRGLEETYDAEAKRRFAEELRTQLAPPRGRQRGIMKYFDFPSVAGQGPEFVLRFTALVTIIFAVIALSVLRLLNSDQAGTILAAIAGYVLGQASARAGRGETEDATQSPQAGKGSE